MSLRQDGLPAVLDVLDIDSNQRKLDRSGKLNINQQNIAYLLDLLAKVENKVNGLVQQNKNLGTNASKTATKRKAEVAFEMLTI